MSDGTNILVYKDLGLVSQVFNEATLTTLHGDLAIGHTRYSTTGSTTWDNAQPVFKTSGAHAIALGHNGNLVNTRELAERVGRRSSATTDTDLVSTLLARELAASGLEDAALQLLPTLAGAFSFVLMDERSVYATRDPMGIRPPGDRAACRRRVVRGLRDGGPRRRRRRPRARSRAGRAGRDRRPGIALGAVRGVTPCRALRLRVRLPGAPRLAPARDLGARGASRDGTDPCRRAPGRRGHGDRGADTAVSAAQGYAEVSGIPYGEGLIKNRYVGRTFIQPSPSLRQRGVKLKLNPLPDSIRGKRLVVVDDSIVRGTTQQQVVQVLREAGATEIHIRITSPPIRWPCFYGIDMSTRQELIAASRRRESGSSWGPTRSRTSRSTR